MIFRHHMLELPWKRETARAITVTRRALFRFVSVLLCALLPAGCGPHTRPLGSGPRPLVKQGRIHLTFIPRTPRALDLTRFEVHVTGKDNLPLSGARVTASLDMPAMTMPTNKLSLTQAAPGTYVGQGRFTMTGPWTVTINADGKGTGLIEVFAIDVN